MLTCLCALLSCTSDHPESAKSRLIPRKGDEILACGQYIHTGATVVLWTDAGGFDAYGSADVPTTGNPPARRYNSRFSDEQLKATQGIVTPALLRGKVDEFVLHFDVCGISRQCFRVLQQRGLSVHFMLDVDGTIYQTLDLQERAWHATSSNNRSVGIEIANIGAYDVTQKKTPLAEWYRKEPGGGTRLVIPAALGGSKSIRTPGFIGHPARDQAITGQIQGENLRMYDLTPQQYDSLIKLTATLCSTFPKITCDYPRGSDGKLITRRLPDAQLAGYQGILGHYHVQTDKTDPGPALQWDTVIDGARAIIRNKGAR